MERESLNKPIIGISIILNVICYGAMYWPNMGRYYLMDQEDKFKLFEEENGLKIKMQKGINKRQKKRIIKKFVKLPRNIKDEFINKGWEIYLVKGTLHSYNPELKEGTMGLTMFNNKKMFFSIKGNSIDGSFFHEFGHFIDAKEYRGGYEFASRRNSFTKVMNKEVKYMRYEPAKKDCREFFAEVYYISMERPLKAQKKYPETLKFIQERIDEH